MFYKVCRALALLFARILFRVRVDGLENVPKDGGYILAANHRTNYDPILIAAWVAPQIHYMAKVELFNKNRFCNWLFTNVGAFPVERGKGDTGAISWALDIIRGGGVLGMFIEGTRSKDGTLGRPKSGTALVASQTGAGVVPCAVCFGKELGFRTKITIRYGKLISNSELGFSTQNSPHEVKAATRRIMDEIVKLLGDQG